MARYPGVSSARPPPATICDPAGITREAPALINTRASPCDEYPSITLRSMHENQVWIIHEHHVLIIAQASLVGHAGE